jgi:hypothetical protein
MPEDYDTLETSVKFWKQDSAAAWDKCEELRKRLDRATALIIKRLNRDTEAVRNEQRAFLDSLAKADA